MIIDPITLEVVRGRLDVITEEMQFALIRSSYSNVVKEAADASTALFDLHGQTIAQASAIPLHLGVLVPAVQRLLVVFPPETMREGDLYTLNDPHEGGTHLPDIIVTMPVFFEGHPVALTCAITHHQDVGGKTPGSIPTDATEIFQEGLRLPPLKLYDAGTPNQTLLSILERNVRFPGDLLGDLDAQVAACRVGGRRLQELLREYGESQTLACVSALLDRSERLTRAKIAEIPGGSYTFVDYLDNDGIDLERRVPLQVNITIQDSDVFIDFDGTSPQVKGPFNAAPSTALAAAIFVIRAVTDPQIPSNAGCYRPLHVRLPEGSLVNPSPPAALNARTPTFNLIVDALLGALAQAVPERIPACSYDSFTTKFGGVDPSSGRAYVFSDIGCGGFGARPTMDGLDVFRSKGGNTLNSPVEAVELDFPLRVHCYGLRVDSGGPGRHRGGLGSWKVFELLRGEATVTHRGERYYTPPWGLARGAAGAPSESFVLRGDGRREAIPSKREFTLRAGDQVHLFSAGGGGYGDPRERSIEAVQADVLDGKVSVDAAIEQYDVHRGGS